MSVLDRIDAFIPRSGIMRAEMVYQRRSMQGRRRRWLRRVWRVILIAGVTMAMILFWGEFAGALLNRDAGPIGETLRIGGDGLILLAFVLHFSLMFQTLGLAANSIARERQNNTWDMLVLTGVDARQIVRGKWWATVQRQWRSYAVLALLRAGAIVWVGAETSRAFRSLVTYNYYGYSTPPVVLLPTPGEILFAGAAVIVLTMLNLGFTAACGVLASTQIRRSTLALGRAIALRLLVVVGTALIGYLFTYIVSQLTYRFLGQFSLPWLGNLIVGSVTTLVDNGASMGVTLGSSHLIYSNDFIIADPSIEVIASAFASVFLYIFLTHFLLARAQRQAVREQALPPLATVPPKSGKIEVKTDTERITTGL